MRIVLVHRSALPHWRVGDRVEWRHCSRWHQRLWLWLTRGNWRVATIDFDNELLILEKCR